MPGAGAPRAENMIGAASPAGASRVGTIAVAGVEFLADPDGALVWPAERLLVVSDLHLEKGSAYAARGVLLPPFDTAATLARLAALILRHDPRAVIALGDSFHDDGAPGRLRAEDRAAIAALQLRREWIWIAGNHDPAEPAGLAGARAREIAIGAVAFRHEPTGTDGEIAGHLHPVARVAVRGRSFSRRCFASDGERLVMPAFGTFAGGLSIRAEPFADVFSGLDFTAYLLGEQRLHAFPATRCA
jgi:hypothetical protein